MNWSKGLDKFKLEKSLKWELAIIKKVNKFSTEIETENKLNGGINYDSINWTKKEFSELFEEGNIVYVKKKKWKYL